MWVGELEGRIKDLAEKVQGHAFIWLLPGFDEALYAGQHARSPMGMLDALLPHVDRGEITLIGEISSAGLERLMAERPRVAGAFNIVRVRPLDEETTIAVAEHKLEAEEFQASRETLTEAYDLAQQFLPHIAPPGNLLRLVDVTINEVEEEGRREFETSDVLAALAASSGLPLAMLDPKAPLELEAVQALLREPRARPAGGGGDDRRADLDDQGRADRPDPAARRLPLRRPDRHREDGDRKDARRVPLRLASAGSSGST